MVDATCAIFLSRNMERRNGSSAFLLGANWTATLAMISLLSMSEPKADTTKDRRFIFGISIFAAIVISAAVLFRLPTTNPEHGRKGTALATATALESAINNIYTEYGKLPDVGSRVTTNSPEGLKLLNILLGIDIKSDNAPNPRGIKFLSVKEGKNNKGGLIYAADGESVEGLYDPWGNPFTVELDTDYNEELHFTVGSRAVDLKGRRAAAFSPGQDKQLGTADDVKTW